MAVKLPKRLLTLSKLDQRLSQLDLPMVQIFAFGHLAPFKSPFGLVCARAQTLSAGQIGVVLGARFNFGPHPGHLALYFWRIGPRGKQVFQSGCIRINRRITDHIFFQHAAVRRALPFA